MKIKSIKQYASAVVAALILPVFSTHAAAIWTKVTTAKDVENFFIQSGEWANIGNDATIPLAIKPYINLPAAMMNRAYQVVLATLPDSQTVSATDSHLARSGELYVWNSFTINLLGQQCGNFNELGYFTYKFGEDDGSIYIGECGIILPYANESAPAVPLGTGYRVTFKQRYDGYVQVGFFIRNKKINWNTLQYTANPMDYAIFSVEEFNTISGKQWRRSMQEGLCQWSVPLAREEFLYVFDEETSKSLFPESSRPVVFGFEDNYYKAAPNGYSWTEEGWPSDWDYNDVVFVCGPLFRESETNRPPISSVTGVIWMDASENGVMDGDEYPLSNIKVELLDSLGGVIDTEVTGLNGMYRFEEIEGVETFHIRFEPGERWQVSPLVEADDDDVIANRFDPETGLSVPLNLEGDTHLYHINLGISPVPPPDC